MKLGRTLYGALSQGLHLAAPLIFHFRAQSGKEDPRRRNERFARDLPPRPEGGLVWMHGASVGESMLLHAVAERLQAARDDLTILFTSQTATSAALIGDRLGSQQIHQMAPIDSPAVARRFVQHWRPDVTVVAEGEIWPNLLGAVHTAGSRLALINARMTDRSVEGWSKWPSFARAIFSRFDLILAADTKTATGLSRLTDREITTPGNLKTALPPPMADPSVLDQLKDGFIGDRPCLLAASTHPGEETLFLDAVARLDRPVAAIIVPRHPERAETILGEIAARGVSVSRWSTKDPYDRHTDVLLADTIGEMGLWLRLADVVYLGGAHASDVGGHNPIEALRLGKPILTGPDGFNFADVFPRLVEAGALSVVEGAEALASALRDQLDGSASKTDAKAVEAFLKESEAPLRVTLDGLLDLLDEGRRR